MRNYLLCCDWGTSSFRLGLYDLKNDRLIDEVHTKDGVASIHKAWQSINGASHRTTRHELFRKQLSTQIEALSSAASIDLKNVPIVISGMVSSSIGMEYIPYADLPFAVDGSNIMYRVFESNDNFPHEIILISGIMGKNEVMRGEETQLMGLMELLKSSNEIPPDAILIFPGTHSKHIHVQNGILTHFDTYMTGELFHVLVNYSILKDSVESAEGGIFSENDAGPFRQGLQHSANANIMNAIFTVRTNELFDKLNKRQNFYYLSGLLIGSEVNHLLEKENCSLYLCSAGNLYNMYKLALKELDTFNRSTVVPIEVVDRSALAGQVMIYRKYILNVNVP